MVTSFDKNGKFVKNNFSLFFNFDEFAYVWEHSGQNDKHNLAFSSKIIRNLYLGSLYHWNNKNFKSGKLNESFLFRPFNCVSVGATVGDVFAKERNYRVGAALRPFYFKGDFWNRLTVSADFNYLNEEWQKPIIGLQSEFVNGINLAGSYNLETETIAANIGVNFSHLKIGSLVGLDTENKPTGGNYYLNINERSFRTFANFGRKELFYDFRIKNKIVEKKPVMEIGPFKVVSDKEQTLAEIIEKIKKLENDDNIKGIVFKSGNFATSFANFTELKNALEEFKAKGKKVIFYFDSIGNINYVFAASVADEIYLYPLGEVYLRGIAVALPYLKDALDKLGIEVVNFRSHKYKTAGNMFSETEMTPAERESYETLLGGLYDEMIKMIEEGRGKKLKKTASELIDEGPYFDANKALEAGLVDDLIYEDQLEDKLKEFFPKSKITKKMPSESIVYDWSEKKKDKIAVIYAVGNIHMGKGKAGKSIGSETTAEAIRKARKDKSVKGIILRVDSGGGSALASDIIAREVQLCKSGKNAKPVVVSMAGVAASGGYYIAAYSDEIIAQPNTITGSIGVVGMFPVLERMYDKLHINWSTVKKGKHSDFGKTYRQMTREEKKMMKESIEQFYDTFIGVVAKGRNMDKETVNKYAQGRVWTGKQALERGLVDKLGGMDVAVEEMKKLANLKHEVDLVEYEAGKEKLVIHIDTKRPDETVLQEILPEDFREIIKLGKMMKQYENEKALMLMPFEIKIK